jgi:hypothetical protein
MATFCCCCKSMLIVGIWNLEIGNYIWNLGFVSCNKGRENRHKILEWLWIGSLCSLLHAMLAIYKFKVCDLSLLTTKSLTL